MNIVGSIRVLAPALAWMIAAAAWSCPASPEPVEKRFENNAWQFVWELKEAPTWLGVESAPIPASLQEYRDYANGQTDTDPFVLLARQRAVFEKAYGINDPSLEAFRLIERREVGRIANSSCLELMLMAEHLKFHPLNVPGSEFSARIYRKQSQLKVFASFIEHESMGAPGVAISLAQRNEIQKNAWQFTTFLHNHPFSFQNPYGDISGTVIPSDPDLVTFRSLFEAEGLQAAWITNGIHSARYQSMDTDRLLSTIGL
ncbi:MAG TPA: hypothetical protein VE954_24980 [Oligoflexus sp.]|uniref:hypothetical protein n=1 Tax=Oligoflexus sp. TaxID=1971216 RepID=UPI002D24D083|nr:hypothetical protein [Oligoflexus sp.]HYX36373.1 hypothetical protein [Oligoflexus sp.]